jgi:hypothetical protein
MIIDFTPLKKGGKVLDLAAQYSLTEMRAASEESLAIIHDIIADLDDAAVTFDPEDPEANDPHAVPGEEHIGWNLAHLIAHVTASTEEWAAYSSILARGITYPADPRLRYETPWREITTRAQCIQRLEESRRIRNAYLDTWPDKPHLDVYRELSPRFVARLGEFNAPACFLFGLSHEFGHHDQMREVRRQALEARATTG